MAEVVGKVVLESGIALTIVVEIFQCGCAV